MRKTDKRKLLNMILFSPIVLSVGVFPISVSTSIKNKKNIDTISNNNLNNSSVAFESVNSFSDYDSIVNNTTFQSISTKIGFLGKTKDSKTAILTSYGGLIVWSNTIAENQIVIDFYNSKNINDISNYRINGWINVSIGNFEYIAILFGSLTYENQIVLFLDAATGEVYTPYTNVNPSTPNLYVGNICFIGDKQTMLYKTSTSKILAIGGITSAEISSSAHLITLTARSVTSFKPIVDSIGLDPNDKFVGFTPGFLSAGSTVDFFQFKKTNNTIYTVVVDLKLQNIMNNNAKVYQDLSEFVPTNTFTEDKIVKYGFFHTSGSNSTINKFVYLVPGQHTKLHNVTYNVTTKIFSKTELDISTSKPNDEITNLIFDYTNNKLYFSLAKSNESIITYVNVASANMKYETLKAKGNITINKPWLMSPVINSGASSAFVAINNDNKVVRNYTKSDQTVGEETELTFSKYNDYLTSIKNDIRVTSNNMPSNVDANILLGHFNISNNNSVYATTIINATRDNNLGTISFKYNVSYKNWWNLATTSSFQIPVFIDGLYNVSKVNVAFVLSENVDPVKYAKIESLKEQKQASQITKKEVIDNFISASIIDKNGNKFAIQESHISLQSLENDYALKVTLTLPSVSFPNGYNKLIYTAIFKGFSKLEGYDAIINANDSSSIAPYKLKFPSEITFENVISQFINLKQNGYSFQTNREDWDYQFSYDDYLGIFKITKLRYKRTVGVPSSLPNSKREVIGLNNQQTYTGFKNLLTSFNKKPNLKDLASDMVGKLTPTEIWDEYNKAILSGNNNDVVSSLLYNNFVFDLVDSATDLIFVPTNLSTANQEKKLKFTVKFKENAKLNIKYKGNNLVFTKDVENNLINKNPDKNYYPFFLEWNIESSNQYFEWNIPPGSGFIHNNGEDGVERLTIDLDQQNWQLINRQMTVYDFLKNPDAYKIAIIQLFNYSDNYEPLFSDPISNYEQGIVTIRIDFVEKNDFFANTKSQIIKNSSQIGTTKEITITGFKIPVSQFAIIIPLVISIIISLLICVTITYIFLRTKKVTIKKQRVFESKKILEYQKEKYSNIIITEDVEKETNNSSNKKQNKNLAVNRLQGINSKYKKR